MQTIGPGISCHQEIYFKVVEKFFKLSPDQPTDEQSALQMVGTFNFDLKRGATGLHGSQNWGKFCSKCRKADTKVSVNFFLGNKILEKLDLCKRIKMNKSGLY